MKNLHYSISTRQSNGSYRNIYSLNRMFKKGYFNKSSVPDGLYPFRLQGTIFCSIFDLPEVDGITMVPSPGYPQFTDTLIVGMLEVRKGRLVPSSIDKYIPSEYMELCNHVYLEGLREEDGKFSLMMGS